MTIDCCRYLGDILPKEVVDSSKMPVNDSLVTIVSGMISAWELYDNKQ